MKRTGENVRRTRHGRGFYRRRRLTSRGCTLLTGYAHLLGKLLLPLTTNGALYPHPKEHKFVFNTLTEPGKFLEVEHSRAPRSLTSATFFQDHGSAETETRGKTCGKAVGKEYAEC